MEYQSYTLPNGLRIIHLPSEGNVSYCGFFVNAGTRDEASDQFGMAHFTEHMLFKGTAKRRAHHIINRMENVGGELNAYTNKEETVIYSIFLEEHIERAVELLADLIFGSQFPQNEIDKERDVVIDEIHSYDDSPSELIYDDFENLIFCGSQLGHNILGSAESLQTFDSDSVKRFVGMYYHAANMVFFSMGRTPMKRIVRLCEKYIIAEAVSVACSPRVKPICVQSVHNHEDKDTTQVHALIGGQSYPIFDERYKTLLLVNNILGGPGMNSRLNVSLREKYGYVYNVESSVTGYTDTGMTSIYFGCDKSNLKACLSLTYRQLRRLRECALSTSQLHAAKRQFMGQIGVSTDNRENLALSLGKSFFHFNSYDSLSETMAKIERISSADVLEVANEIFDETNLSSLIYN